MRKFSIFIVLALGLAVAGCWSSAISQTGDCTTAGTSGCIDSTFGGGWVITDVTPYQASGISAIAIQHFANRPPRIVAVGTSYGMWTLAGYDTSGALDTSFGSGGIAQITYSPTIAGVGISDVVIQADNGIVVVGTTATSSSFKFTVARFTPDGAPDPTFGTGASYAKDGIVIVPFDAKPNSESVGKGLALQSNGQIIVVGTYKSNLGIARLNADGTLDSTFGPGGTGTFASSSEYSCSGEKVAIDSQNRIVIVGSVRPPAPRITRKQVAPPNPPRNCVLRLTANGTLDTSFGKNGMTTTEFFGTTEQPYGGKFLDVAIYENGDTNTYQIVAVGYAYTSSNSSHSDYQMVVASYNAPGDLDPSFGPGFEAGGGLHTAGYSCAIQNGKIWVAGYIGPVDQSTYSRLGLWRLTQGGAPDLTFGPPDADFHQWGFVDTTIAWNGGAGHAVAQQDVGLFIVAGAAYTQSGVSKFAIGRYYE